MNDHYIFLVILAVILGALIGLIWVLRTEVKAAHKEHAALMKLLNEILFEQRHMCLTVNGALKHRILC